ncbi:MAG: histidine phosphatase family protein [Blautia sp.]|nr:histidine phosphatase family protein [Blautia sp.]
MFYLVRHGKTDYSEKDTGIYQGFGVNLAPLSEKGVEQAEKAASKLKKKKIDLIISSPYTRALQTAAIISRKTGARIIVETDLHEWVADTEYRYVDNETAEKRYESYVKHDGVYPEGKTKKWESKDSLKKRMDAVLSKYSEYENVAVVCHGTIIEAASGVRLKTGGAAGYSLTE